MTRSWLTPLIGPVQAPLPLGPRTGPRGDVPHGIPGCASPPGASILRFGGGRYCVQATLPGLLGVTAPTVGGVENP